LAPFALSLSKPSSPRTVRAEPVEALFGVVKAFAGRLTVGRGLPGGKFLSLSRQRKEQKKGDPDSPEFPEIEPAGRAAKNSPRLAVFNWFFVGGAQTPSPLIRPAG